MATANPCRPAAALALWLAASAALANPSVAPGLWEYRSTMKSNDPAMQQAMVEAQKALASMPPEQRRQMEQMMAAQGKSFGAMGSGGATTGFRVCITPEQAARQELPPPDEKCTHRITGRSANSLKFAIDCPAERVRGEGEMVFANARAYDGRFTMQQVEGGKTMKMESTIAARWLAADCGTIKPAK
ncbi:MAG: hypothetical protein RL227_2965 [Pseudomonadota bacterium]